MKKMFLLFSGIFLMLSSYSQAGQPDLNFGNGGSINPPGNGPIAIQNDGKIVQVSAGQGPGKVNFMVTRFNVDGSLDNTFNGSGIVTTDFGFETVYPTSILVLTDGKILVAGATKRDNPPDYRILVARYNPDGSVDQTFHGTGFNSVGNLTSNAYLAIETNGSGNILVVGDFTVTRFKSNGDVDSSLGTYGTLRTRDQLTANFAIAAQTDGKIVLGGLFTRNADDWDFALARYNHDGSPDVSFDGDGVAITPIQDRASISSLLIQPDGKILTAGTASQLNVAGITYVVARYNTNGSLDNSFDGDGILLPNIGAGSDPASTISVALMYDNRIIISGNNLLSRFFSTGQIDNTFDSDGTTAIDIKARYIATRENRVYIAGTKSSGQAIGAYRLGIAPQTGLFYKYYEGTWTTLPDFNSLTAIKSGNTDNINIEVRTPGRNDNFAFIWRGYINITTPGSYTFETMSDDGSKVYFNATYSAGGIALVNNDGIHAPIAATGTVNIPAVGLYPITFTYFENNGGESMQAYWTGPGIPRQLIPNSAFGGTTTTPPPTDGLNYKYYEGTWNTLPDFTSLTPVKTGNTPNVDIGVRTPGRNDNFAFVWEGTINMPAPGTYTFTTTSDDGSKLYFNSQYVPSAVATVNNDGLHAPTSISGTVNVPAAGAYPIAITFFEKDGGEAMNVSWSGPGFASQPISNSAFSKPGTPVMVSGLTYKLYQGSFDLLPDFSTLVPIKTGNSPNVDIGVRPADINDNFAFVWEGFITIPTSGVQTFSTLSDDGSRVVINGITVTNNDGTHGPQTIPGTITLAAGTYPITISYFDKTGGQVMELYWLAGSQLVPNSAFTTTTIIPPTQNSGLNYKYYEGDFNTLPEFNSLTPVKTGVSPQPDISVRRSGVNDHFAFVWEGNITLPTPGDYTFELVSDDGSKFYFNSAYSPSAVPLINNDGIHAATSVSTTINASGTHPIAITYFEKDGGETFQLYWTGPGIARQLVPASAFTTLSSAAVNKTAIAPQFSAADITSDITRVTRIYPNPFAESFLVSFYNEKATDQISVAVYDVDGKQLYNQYAGKLSQGATSLMIDLKNKQLKDGIYFVTIVKNGVRSQTIKLMKH